MVRHRHEKRLSKNLRHGTTAQRAALLDWMNMPKFDNRKPTPDELVKECLRKRSPMYGLMKTNRDEAAAAYYRTLAQDIIRHIDVVRVVIKTGEEITKPVRAWFPISIDEKGRIGEEHYIPTQRAIASKAVKGTVIDAALRDLKAYIERYRRYGEFLKIFSPVVAAYDEVVAAHEKLVEANRKA